MPTLDWIGKRAVLNHHREVPYHLLKCDGKLSVGDPGSGNLLVQGDNLLALKALLPYYAGKVKCVYIDPPYNTGKEDWIYNDAVNSPEMVAWLGKVVGREAEDLSRHDKWLCMMYPRLCLLRKFLSDDGVILISIGDDECGHLRILCDEVFGTRNRVATFVWNTEGHTENQERVTAVHEYVLCYEMRPQRAVIRDVVDPDVAGDSKIRRDFAENSITKNGAANPPTEVVLPTGFPCAVKTLLLPAFAKYKALVARAAESEFISRGLTSEFAAVYPVRKEPMVVKNGKLAKPCRVFSGWSSLNKLKQFIENGCNPIDDDGTSLRFYLSDRGVIYYYRQGRISKYVQTVLRNVGTTEKNRYELEAMGLTFPYPKPKELISYLLSIFTAEGDLILDSFAGSGTTGHAAMMLNSQAGGRRSWIAVELDKAIALDVTRKRLASVAEGYTSKAGSRQGKKVTGLGGGFRYCTLGPPLFDSDGGFSSDVRFNDLAAHIWFTETGEPLPRRVQGTPLLGVFKDAGAADNEPGTALYLLFNGVLGDRRPQGGNVLTADTLAALPKHDSSRIVYGEGCRLGAERLKRAGVTFKQIPYQVKGV